MIVNLYSILYFPRHHRISRANKIFWIINISMGSRVMQLSCQTHYIYGQKSNKNTLLENLKLCPKIQFSENEKNCEFEFSYQKSQENQWITVVSNRNLNFHAKNCLNWRKSSNYQAHLAFKNSQKIVEFSLKNSISRFWFPPPEILDFWTQFAIF